MPIKTLDPLDVAVPSSDLFRDWLRGDLDPAFLPAGHREAGRELHQALQARPGFPPPPLFASSWAAGWSDTHLEDFPDDGDRDRFRGQVRALQEGRAEVVVTGQQPGFLGGPLYTLYKVATAIALADLRSAAGSFTVPVFWSGDDDDDLIEALEPVGWVPPGPRLAGCSALDGVKGARTRSMVLGRMADGSWKEEAAALLARLAAVDDPGSRRLARDLREIHDQAQAGAWNWARLSRRTLLRVFRGSGLIVVSGDDPGLHAAAGPLYEMILARRDTLTELVRRRGAQLAADRWHAQISDRSLAHPLFTIEDGLRVPLPAGGGFADWGRLRPGVMLRSPIQDWLLRPAAVVVGPAELAYLRQLDPLYGELGVTRSALVPRLFAWLLPAGFDLERIADFRQGPEAEAGLAIRLAAEAEQKARLLLEEILVTRLGLAGERARSLSAGRARRWSKGVAAMLRGEIEKSRRDSVSGGPVWVFPGGKRQERGLAFLGAAALWGDDLVAACLQAARRHLQDGAEGSWREYAVEVPVVR